MKRFALLLATLLGASSARAQDVPARPKDNALISFDAGYAYQNLYSTGIDAIGVSAVLGGDFSTWAMAAIAELDRGWTEYGLTTTAFTVGMLFEGHFERFRLGAGPRLGFLFVDRVTDGNALFSPSAGLFTRASFDLITFNEGHGAFFVVGKASADTLGSTGLYGCTAGLGVRF